MAKKSESSKKIDGGTSIPKTPVRKKTVAPPVAEAAPAPAPAPAARKRKPAKAPEAGSAAAVGKGSKRAVFSNDDIALRAYFIAEKRRNRGIPGDEHQDWLEAERQLRAEK